MPKGDAKEAYLNTNAHLEAKVAMLMAQLAESQAREAKMRVMFLTAVEFGAIPPFSLQELREQFDALPPDDSALREMIEAAKAEERERVFGAIEQAWYAQGLDVRGASISDFLSAIRARNPEKPSGLSERVMTVFAQMQAVSHGRARKG